MAIDNKSGFAAINKAMDELLEDDLLEIQNYREIAENNQLQCESIELEECNEIIARLIDTFSNESFAKDPNGTFAEELTEELNRVRLSIQALNENRDAKIETEDPDVSRTKAERDILSHVFNCKTARDGDPNVLRGLMEGARGAVSPFRIDTTRRTKYEVTNLLWDLVGAE